MASQVRIEVEIKTANASPTGRDKGPKAHQEVWIDLGQAYPVRGELALWRDDQPKAPGRYTLGLDALVFDRFGNLGISMKNLTPVVTAKGAAA